MNFYINIAVLNTLRFGVFVHTFLENGDQLVVVASEKSCVYRASKEVYFF